MARCCTVRLSMILLCAGLMPISAKADETQKLPPAVDTEVAVQFAMLQGNDFLRQGNTAKAVEILESQLSRIDGNRKYLMLLRRAYIDHITNLHIHNKTDLANKYIGRLAILDPQTAATLKAQPDAQLTRADSSGLALKGAGNPKSQDNPGPARIETPIVPEAPRPIVRAKNLQENNDPFAKENALGNDQPKQSPSPATQDLLTKADWFFQQRRFTDALRFYEQVAEVNRSATIGKEDRWAYCKLHQVVEVLNKPGQKPLPLADLEKEVRSALIMAPGLQKTGQWLLQQIAQQKATGANIPGLTGKTPAVTIDHRPEKDHGWAVAETRHFRIFHGQKKEFVEEVARIAEQTRVEMTNKWFGTNVEEWRHKCDIYLHATAQEYTRTTGVPGHSPGHSRIESDQTSGKIVSRRIDLRCDNPELLQAILPHETTHVILAGQFGPHPVPRWVDEGVAVLAEPTEKMKQHLANLQKFAGNRELFAVKDLIQMHDYPSARQIGPFYAQSVSLVGFLSRQRGPQVFSQFVRDGLQQGYQPALQRHYGFRDFNELENQWSQRELTTATSSEKSNGLAQR